MEINITDSITIQDLNDREIRKLIAPIVYLTLLMVVGIPGNLTVLIIYHQKYAKSVYRTIIWNLALVDFVFCTLTFPFNIGRLIRYYTFTELWVCKMFTTIIIFFVMYSSHLLVILAIHRFRQVCMPLKVQITDTNVKYWICGGLFLAVFLDIPQGILQPIDEEKLENNITGHVCAVTFQSSTFAEIYNGFLTFLFASYAAILFILYIFIGRRIYLQRKKKEGSPNTQMSHSENISNKITKIAVTVSAVFAISYVPLFVLKVIASEVNQKGFNSTTFAVYKIFERSYAFNHVANPFIYAFYDKRFRQKFMALLTILCCRRTATGRRAAESFGRPTSDPTEEMERCKKKTVEDNDSTM